MTNKFGRITSVPVPRFQSQHVYLKISPDAQLLKQVDWLFDLLVERHHSGVFFVVCNLHSAERSRECTCKVIILYS